MQTQEVFFSKKILFMTSQLTNIDLQMKRPSFNLNIDRVVQVWSLLSCVRLSVISGFGGHCAEWIDIVVEWKDYNYMSTFNEQLKVLNNERTWYKMAHICPHRQEIQLVFFRKYNVLATWKWHLIIIVVYCWGFIAVIVRVPYTSLCQLPTELSHA